MSEGLENARRTGTIAQSPSFRLYGQTFIQYGCPLDDPGIDLPLKRPEMVIVNYTFLVDEIVQDIKKRASVVGCKVTYRIGNTFSLCSMIFMFDGLEWKSQFAQYPGCINVSLIHVSMVDLR